MKIITSWDDGKIQDLQLAEFLREYKMPAIFYIPSNSELSPAQIVDLSSSFEIGGHTVNHPRDLKLLSDRELKYEVEGNKDWLEDVIEKPVTSFCYPRGRYDDRVVEAVKGAGFLEARAVGFGNTDLPTDQYRIKPTVHVRPREEYGMPWLEYAKMKFLEAKGEENGYYHLWGHSWLEIAKMDLWDDLERLFVFINENLSTK